ncbi:MAG: hypothetical protein KF775_04090 [Cyclobacteriaceae bacterium]|nr:hypothetical protein [Cyclobacteriaceae bacterium]
MTGGIKSRLAFYLRRRIEGRIVLLESDDWGLERADSERGIAWATQKFGSDNFSRWTTDALETPEDLDELFQVLEKFKTKFDKPPVITANFITHKVTLNEEGTLQYIPLSQRISAVKKYYAMAIQAGLLCPQFHGFSHYNTSLVEQYSTSAECKEAHENGFMLARATIKGSLNFLHGEYSKTNLKAMDQFQLGMEEFKNVFGFYSTSLIPPTYIFDLHYSKPISAFIRYLQGGNQLTDTFKKRHTYSFLRKHHNIIWGVRNARLDPHPHYNFGYEQCLLNIKAAFQNKLPATIDFHRVNFSGRFAPKYRTRTIQELTSLFMAIYKHWPDAQFLTTPQLISLLHGTSQSD